MIFTLVPKSALNPRAYAWTSEWHNTVPHIWAAQKRHRHGIVVFEVETGLCAIRRGVPAWTAIEEALTVHPPSGYEIVMDCERPWPTVWHPMHATFRRYAIYPSDRPELREKAQEFASLYSVPTVESYGPTNAPLPQLSEQQQAAARTRMLTYNTRLRGLLETGGVAGIEDSQDGLLTLPVDGWRPWGIPERFAHGGSGIYFWTGYERTRETPAYLWLVSACTHERAWHAYDADTGAVVTAEFYGDPGPKYQQATGDPNNGWLPEFRGVAKHPDPLIPPYDNAHSIRGFRHLVALSEMTDSPMIKRSLKSRAAQMRLQFSEIGPYPSGGYAPPSLRTSLAKAKERPGGGAFGEDTGRQLGWPAYVIAQSIKKGCAENIPWAKMFVEFTKTAAMPNGIFSRCHSNDASSVWYHDEHDLAHSFEVPILDAGTIGCALHSGRRVPQFVVKGLSELYEHAPAYPYYNGYGPPNYAFVAARGGNPYPNIPGGKNNAGDFTHVMTGAALAAAIDGDARRWVMACRRFTDVDAAFASLDLRNSAGLLAQLQA